MHNNVLHLCCIAPCTACTAILYCITAAQCTVALLQYCMYRNVLQLYCITACSTPACPLAHTRATPLASPCSSCRPSCTCCFTETPCSRQHHPTFQGPPCSTSLNSARAGIWPQLIHTHCPCMQHAYATQRPAPMCMRYSALMHACATQHPCMHMHAAPMHAYVTQHPCMHMPPSTHACMCHPAPMHAYATQHPCMHMPLSTHACLCQPAPMHAHANQHAPMHAYTTQHPCMHMLLSTHACMLPGTHACICYPIPMHACTTQNPCMHIPPSTHVCICYPVPMLVAYARLSAASLPLLHLQMGCGTGASSRSLNPSHPCHDYPEAPCRDSPVSLLGPCQLLHPVRRGQRPWPPPPRPWSWPQKRNKPAGEQVK